MVGRNAKRTFIAINITVCAVRHDHAAEKEPGRFKEHGVMTSATLNDSDVVVVFFKITILPTNCRTTWFLSNFGVFKITTASVHFSLDEPWSRGRCIAMDIVCL